MPILAPPVPVTPNVWSALPADEQPVFYYRAPHAAFEAFVSKFNE